MAKKANILTAKGIGKITVPGRYLDGAGLYLAVSKAGTQSWVYRFKRSGKPSEIGLGSVKDVSLAEARIAAGEARAAVREGRDPKRGKSSTFKQAATEYIADRTPHWRNPKTGPQWTASLEAYAYPTIGHLDVAAITVDDLLTILKPIWATKTETATRVRSRIQNIIDFAIPVEQREGINPAMWESNLKLKLPARDKVNKRKNFEAMDYHDAPAFYQAIAKDNCTSSRALRLLMLTAARSQSIRGAHTSEVDGDVWTVPDVRMKHGEAFRIPLSAPALEIFEETGSGLLFLKQLQARGSNPVKYISDNTMRQYLKERHPTLTVHGFRSCFRDWIADETNHRNKVAEMSLAHKVVGSEGSYRRKDMLKKRRKLMNDWADYLTG